MTTLSENNYTFCGEVVEVFDQGQNRRIKIICKPGSLLIEAADKEVINLGDSVIITGTFEVKKMETFQ